MTTRNFARREFFASVKVGLKGYIDGKLELWTYDTQISSGAIGVRGGNDSQEYYDDVRVIDLDWLDNADSKTKDASAFSPGSSVSDTVESLDAGTVYYFLVKTKDEVPYWSGISNLASAQACSLNAPVAGAFSDISTGQIRANWSDPGGNPWGTQYFCENITKGTNSDNTSLLYWISTGLNANSSYDFRVKCVSGTLSSGWTNLGSTWTWANPPTSAGHSANTTTGITWTWASGGAQKDYYAWDNDGHNSGWITDTSWTPSGYSANTQYTFYVKARNEADVQTSYVSTTAYTSANLPNAAAFSNVTKNSIQANWTGDGTQYYCEYDDDGGFGTPNGNSDWTTNLSTQACSLSEATTYYFHVKARNGDNVETSSWCDLGSTTTLKIAPGDIDDLTATTSFYPGKINLSWTSVGDDEDSGDITDGKYEIRYSSDPAHANPAGWDQMPYSVQWATNTSPGDGQSRTISSLDAGTTYYFYIKTRDEVPNNWSALSNLTSTWAQYTIKAVSFDIESHSFGKVALGASTYTVTEIVVKNDGNVPLKYGLSCDTTTAGGSPWFPGNVGEDNSVYNRFILKGVFHGSKPDEETGFGDEDTIERTTRWSQATSTFTVSGGDETGVDVPPEPDGDNTRHIWFRLDLPKTSATSHEQEITVTITAK